MAETTDIVDRLRAMRVNGFVLAECEDAANTIVLLRAKQDELKQKYLVADHEAAAMNARAEHFEAKATTAELHLSAWKAEAEAWRAEQKAEHMPTVDGECWNSCPKCSAYKKVVAARRRTDELTGGQHA